MKRGRTQIADPFDQRRAGWHSSFLNFMEDTSGWPLHVYADAYHRAARTLTRSLLRTRWPGMQRDAGIIPILFLWRHHLEISLKAIIAEIADYEDRAKPSIESTHDLMYLWGLAKKGLGELVLADEDIKRIDRAVRSFSGFDPDSQSFRYPKLKGGQRAATGLNLMDARTLSHAMTEVAKALEIARYGLDGLLWQRDEARRSSQWL